MVFLIVIKKYALFVLGPNDGHIAVKMESIPNLGPAGIFLIFVGLRKREHQFMRQILFYVRYSVLNETAKINFALR